MGQIMDHYLANDFLTDFIPLIPFQWLDLKNNRENYFLILKLFRLAKANKVFDPPKIMMHVKTYFTNRL